MSTPKTPAQRVIDHDKRLVEAGGTLLRVRLSPEANAALETITSQFGESRTAVINRLILSAVTKN